MAGVLGLSVAPAVIALAAGKEELSAAVVAAVVIGAGALALAAEDEAGNVLAAVPVTLARRRGLRLAVLALAAVVTWGVVLAAVLQRDPHAAGRVVDRLAETAAVSGIGFALASSAYRRDRAVAPASLLGPLAVLVISAFAYRYPDLPAIGTAGNAGRWATIAGIGWLAAAWECRDLYGLARRR